jgi:hypothetical protein
MEVQVISRVTVPILVVCVVVKFEFGIMFRDRADSPDLSRTGSKPKLSMPLSPSPTLLLFEGKGMLLLTLRSSVVVQFVVA